ncbi:MAG: hypothetical protein HY725_11725 [Candidatus Rokubacteria bacterium]|nr:hypothetical protein [Candidatus Rokubacteria bacterium]
MAFAFGISGSSGAHMDGWRRAEEFERLVAAALPSFVEAVTAQGKGPLYRAVLALVEGPLLRHALALSGGNQLKAARLLGINRNTLRKRLRLLGLLPSPR